jgi:aminopeptidase N
VVTSAGYEDEWLQEALANYLALAALEQREGAKAADEVLAEYKQRLLQKQANGAEVDSAGPVTFGARLNSSQTPGAWRTIVYDKGAWVIHMLRQRMGDAPFWAMLRELVERYRHQSVSTRQFQALAAEFLARQPAKGSYRELDPSLDQFFETWTASTGIPALKLQWRVSGKAPRLELTGRIEQSEVPEGFTDVVPVEIQVGRGRSIVRWVRTSEETAEFRVPLTAPPTKVMLDPGGAVLKR